MASSPGTHFGIGYCSMLVLLRDDAFKPDTKICTSLLDNVV
jgi:hypothetical protein